MSKPSFLRNSSGTILPIAVMNKGVQIVLKGICSKVCLYAPLNSQLVLKKTIPTLVIVIY